MTDREVKGMGKRMTQAVRLVVKRWWARDDEEDVGEGVAWSRSNFFFLFIRSPNRLTHVYSLSALCFKSICVIDSERLMPLTCLPFPFVVFFFHFLLPKHFTIFFLSSSSFFLAREIIKNQKRRERRNNNPNNNLRCE